MILHILSLLMMWPQQSTAVNDPPRLQPILLPDMVSIGDNVVATCALRGGSKPIKFKWTKDGQEMKNVPHAVVENSNDYSMLTITSATRENMGNYTCSVENTFGQDQSSFPLIIKAPPTWLERPQDVKTSEDKSASLFCSAFGYPKPVISWTKDGINIIGDTGSHSDAVTIFINGTLLIPSVKSHHAGVYTCTANNGVDPILNTTVLLTVNGKAVI
ncbi:hypothetical protein JTE90_017448 [Oedothorax gibbosus]|uniref:Ig-like domain-containing protein n=1 Tax=Oedothorax gibbosus TaxID=931172 RepID=A0AAV6U2D3_9ARAC|nr:hypothetical protein JTE90_017448 [Oedothorax gibbosus]